ncbi:uncharacterized protein LOC129595197 [Paramacrobiotus metropolitanus]|uniref:uncharacterized protein LOC129595197 n=1 Tax=Paramacrobiotus metropolitanus TaxID=2943436 RepID=UPI00244595C2|nr:uncharacterized protein LOC129595197 [Paramacrobiotus metropolitanus]
MISGRGNCSEYVCQGLATKFPPCQRGWRTALDCKCSVATSRQLFSDDELEHGFEVPWRASIQLEQVPDNCILTEVQLAFINPYECPTVHVEMKATNTQSIGFINNTLKNIDGQTYSKCCQELGIFREAYCFITMRVPLRSFLRKLLTAFRRTIPLCPAPDEVITVTEGADNVVLTRQGKIEIDRQALAGISSAARAMFAVGAAGKASSYDLDYSKAAVLAVLSAALLKQESLPGDPRRAAPFFLYEVMKLALSWDIPQLKLWTQVAFVERLCHPVANLEQIPVLDAVRIIHDHADGKEVGGRMVLCGLICVLRILHSPTAHWTLDELQQIIEPKSALWKSVIQPTR